MRQSCLLPLFALLLLSAPCADGRELQCLRGGRKGGPRKTAHIHDLKRDTEDNEYANDLGAESGSGTTLIDPSHVLNATNTTEEPPEPPKSRLSQMEGAGKKL